MNPSEIAERARSYKTQQLIAAVRQPFLDEIFAVYNRATPSIVVRNGEFAECTYPKEVIDTVQKLRELAGEACKSAVESAQKRGEL